MNLSSASLLGLLVATLLTAVHVVLQWKKRSAILRRVAAVVSRAPRLTPRFTGTVLVIVNPKSGSNQGEWLWTNVYRPILLAAGVRYEVITTQAASDPAMIGGKLSTKRHEAVLCVSGDGMLHHILNGLPDVDKAPPLGVLPAGTVNVLVSSVSSGRPLCDPVACMYTLLFGQQGVTHVDLIAVRSHTEAGAVTTLDPCMLSIGLIADHDDLQERTLRSLGAAKNVLAPLITIIRRRTFAATIFVDVAPTPHYDDMKDCEEEGPPEAYPAGGGGGQWRVMRGPFLMLTVCNVRQAGTDVLLAPLADHTDGLLDVLVVEDKGWSRFSLAKTFMSLETGLHITLPVVRYVKARRVVVVPDAGADLRNPNLSGEPLPGPAKVYEVTCRRGALKMAQ